MNRIDEEFRKGYEMGMEGKDESELFLDNLNIFRADEEKGPDCAALKRARKSWSFANAGFGKILPIPNSGSPDAKQTQLSAVVSLP